ncbi:septum site-determining protein MinC [Formivibrio citricus]|uniref:Probable septum site-determining protein MinC n=1 Tax=Formivibrio citricus TaxID=83765 RepID=A0A1I5BTR8_9NEIS|nr:septum site-determining protein MinC [Formivibrio citricus]SFN78012.1 septum site-determining protein MinC [Formivibrio citricus]
MALIAPPDNSASPFEFRSAELRLVAFAPATLDPVRLEAGLRNKLGGGEHFLTGEQIALDFGSLPETPDAVEVAALAALLRRYSLNLVAARGGNKDQLAAAREAGLIVLSDEGMAPAAPAPQTATTERTPTLIISRPVRTGQQIYARGGDLVVLALVSAGAEVIADGDIHIYAPLRGRALAGARGDTSARIYTTCMEAEIISVGGVYRTLDETLPASLKSKPAQVYLDQERLVIEALSDIN